MGTHSKPGSTPTSGTSRINPAMAALEAARGAQARVEERIKGVRKFEEEAAERELKINEALAATKRLDEQGPFQGLEDEFSIMVDKINDLDIASFDGNRAEYNKQYNNAMKLLGDFQSIVGLLDNDIDEYQDKSPEELNKLISRSGLIKGKTEEYRKLLNDPSKMGMRIEGNQLIITNDGKDVFNGTSYLNSKKQGFGLIPYTTDMQPKIDKAIKANADNIKNLEKIRQIQREVSGGTKIKGEKLKDYTDAYNAYKNRLEEDPRVDALVNESTYQRFVDPAGDSIYDKTKDSLATKEAIIQYMLEQQFPGHEKVITVATTIKDAKKRKVKGEDKSILTTNYLPIVNKALELSNLIVDPGSEYFKKGVQFETYPGGILDKEKYDTKLKEIKQDLKSQLKDRYALRRLGQKDVIQDFKISIDEKTGEIKVFPLVQKKGSSDLVIQRDFGQGIVVDDNSLFKFDKILGGVDPKTILQKSGAAQFNTK